MRSHFNVAENISGYSISIGIGKRFYAKDLKAVSIALEHYFKHSKHWKKKLPLKSCPLCYKD